MGLPSYKVKRDKFEASDNGMGLGFPCNVCKHRHGTDKDEPCLHCDWNANAVQDDEVPPNDCDKARSAAESP